MVTAAGLDFGWDERLLFVPTLFLQQLFEYMDKKILKLANRKFKALSKEYGGFINVIVDDWRGHRFIFDTKDVRQCKNKCNQCELFQALKNEKPSIFSAGLWRASKKDKKLFGPQNFLNCKTVEQYQKCYINFLRLKVKSKKELADELKLVNNLRIIYSIDGKKINQEKKFKHSILRYVKFNQRLKNLD